MVGLWAALRAEAATAACSNTKFLSRTRENGSILETFEKSTDNCAAPGRFVRSRTAVTDARTAVSLVNSSILTLTDQTNVFRYGVNGR